MKKMIIGKIDINIYRKKCNCSPMVVIVKIL